MISRSVFIWCCWLALALVSLPAGAQQIRRDLDYRLIPQPQPVESGDRIEVIEFFFYACPYCNELSPHLERWRAKKPADVVYRRVPVVRHDSWAPLAKTYFTLESMGEVERLHAAVYRSYHVDDLYMSQDKVIAEWAGKHGLDPEKFMSMDYDIQGTPSVVVDGKFLTSTGMTPSVPQVIPVIDGLIRLARQQRVEKSSK
jgi:thiol:disulfide interchange protein DsbA